MRLLANYLLTNETDLVEQVTEWLALFVEKSQPQHQPQLLALLFNHTRLAFIEVHRQHYFESLQQISAVTPQKWSSLTNERQIDFIADINVSSSTGVLVRINEFLKRDINISSVSATSQIEFSEKVAAMVEKISNSQSVTEISSWDKELLMKEGHEFVEQWVNQAVFLHQVLNLFWNTSAKQVFSVLHRASHDILKAQCYDAALKLEKISTSDAECQLLGKHLWETINTFFLSFMHMEDEQLHTPKTLEIGRKILQVCHGSALEASWCTFDVPNNLFIQAWDNALETQLIPIFRELVANAQKALLRLPEQDRRFSLSAYIKGNYIEFEIANTMLADAVTANNFILLDSGTNQIAIPKSHMLGSGLNSIKQRIKKLKGIVDKTQFPEIVVDNKVLLNWKCRFLLPRSKEVT
jgi:SHS2 domain-containing protein